MIHVHISPPRLHDVLQREREAQTPTEASMPERSGNLLFGVNHYNSAVRFAHVVIEGIFTTLRPLVFDATEYTISNCSFRSEAGGTTDSRVDVMSHAVSLVNGASFLLENSIFGAGVIFKLSERFAESSIKWVNNTWERQTAVSAPSAYALSNASLAGSEGPELFLIDCEALSSFPSILIRPTAFRVVRFTMLRNSVGNGMILTTGFHRFQPFIIDQSIIAIEDNDLTLDQNWNTTFLEKEAGASSSSAVYSSAFTINRARTAGTTLISIAKNIISVGDRAVEGDAALECGRNVGGIVVQNTQLNTLTEVALVENMFSAFAVSHRNCSDAKNASRWVSSAMSIDYDEASNNNHPTFSSSSLPLVGVSACPSRRKDSLMPTLIGIVSDSGAAITIAATNIAKRPLCESNRELTGRVEVIVSVGDKTTSTREEEEEHMSKIDLSGFISSGYKMSSVNSSAVVGTDPCTVHDDDRSPRHLNQLRLTGDRRQEPRLFADGNASLFFVAEALPSQCDEPEGASDDASGADGLRTAVGIVAGVAVIALGGLMCTAFVFRCRDVRAIEEREEIMHDDGENGKLQGCDDANTSTCTLRNSSSSSSPDRIARIRSFFRRHLPLRSEVPRRCYRKGEKSQLLDVEASVIVVDSSDGGEHGGTSSAPLRSTDDAINENDKMFSYASIQG